MIKRGMDLELTSEDIIAILSAIEEKMESDPDDEDFERLQSVHDRLWSAYHELNKVEQ